MRFPSTFTAALAVTLAPGLVFSAPTPNKTLEDLTVLNQDTALVKSYLDRIKLSYDAGTNQDYAHTLVNKFEDLAQHLNARNDQNTRISPQSFSRQDQEDICQRAWTTVYAQRTIVQAMGTESKAISDADFGAELGFVLGEYDREINRFVKELYKWLGICTQQLDKAGGDLNQTLKATEADYPSPFITPSPDKGSS